MKDIFIEDFSDPRFQWAFRKYFEELDIRLDEEKWDKLFISMNEENQNAAYVRYDGEEVLGFIQFTSITFTSWFFQDTRGFIREFWVAKEHRGEGHGKDLLLLAEEYFRGEGLNKVILTSDTAEDFYLHCGYKKDEKILAQNEDPVYIKELS